MAQKPRFKLSLKPLADFPLKAKFVLPNGEDAEIVFKVKHVPAKEFQELTQREGIKDPEFIQALATGWDLEEEFNEENIVELVSLFPGAVVALIQGYLAALAGQRVKN